MANKRISQQEVNKISDLRPYFLAHPDADMVQRSCLHYLGDAHQEFALYRENTQKGIVDTSILINQYEQMVNQIVKQFIIKQYQPEDEEEPEDYFEFWVNDEIGSTVNIQDYYLNFYDILFDMITQQPRRLIFEWCDFCVENQDKGYINYKSYSMGLREFSNKKIRFPKEGKFPKKKENYLFEMGEFDCRQINVHIGRKYKYWFIRWR